MKKILITIVVVSSNAKANGTGENVDTSAISDQYKTSSGIIGMNVSASGTAVGANSSSLEGNAFGSVGNTSKSWSLYTCI